MFKNLRKKLIGDKAFYAMVLSVAVPIIVQNGISSFVNLLDNIMVEAYGSPTPVAQVGTISVPDARTLSVSVWDKGLAKSVENYPDIDSNTNMCSIGFFHEGDCEIKFDPIKGGEGTLLLKLYYSLPPRARRGMLMMLNGLRTSKDDKDDE